MPLETYRSTTASTEIFEMLKTISLGAHWYRRTQEKRLYGMLARNVLLLLVVVRCSVGGVA